MGKEFHGVMLTYEFSRFSLSDMSKKAWASSLKEEFQCHQTDVANEEEPGFFVHFQQ